MHLIQLDRPVPYWLTWLGELEVSEPTLPFDTPDQEGPALLPAPQGDDDEGDDRADEPDRTAGARVGAR